MTRRRARLLLVALAAAGCERTVEVLPHVDGAACEGLGPPIQLAGAPACAAAAAASAHRFALCVCGSLELGDGLQTTAIDSTGAPAPQTGAAVGANDELHAAAAVSLAGALYVANGSDEVRFNAPLHAAESLHVGGRLRVDVESDVGGDAWVAGDVDGPLTVGGRLHAPAGANVGAEVRFAERVAEPVSVAPPCDCAEAARLDVAAAVEAAAAHNDDARIGLSPDGLRGGATTTLDLPCGTYFARSIDTAADLTLRVHGRAALAVRGDVILRGALRVDLDAGAELDLIVAGTLASFGRNDLGSPDAPARVRLWIGAADALLLDGNPRLAAVVTAPRAAVTAPTGVELRGSLLAGSFSSGGPVAVVFDRAVLAAGAACGAPRVDPVP